MTFVGRLQPQMTLKDSNVIDGLNRDQGVKAAEAQG